MKEATQPQMNADERRSLNRKAGYRLSRRDQFEMGYRVHAIVLTDWQLEEIVAALKKAGGAALVHADRIERHILCKPGLPKTSAPPASSAVSPGGAK